METALLLSLSQVRIEEIENVHFEFSPIESASRES